jgi:hypothetical protein
MAQDVVSRVIYSCSRYVMALLVLYIQSVEQIINWKKSGRELQWLNVYFFIIFLEVLRNVMQHLRHVNWCLSQNSDNLHSEYKSLNFTSLVILPVCTNKPYE